MRSKDESDRLARMTLLKAARARTNICDFAQFVLREQTTRREITVTPHQRVGLEFARSHPKCVRIWPAGASKTVLTVIETLFQMGTDPTSRGMIVSKTQQIAAKTIGVVRDYIETSPELHLVFPNLRRKVGGVWRNEMLEIERPDGIPDPSLAAYGITGSIQGSRLNWAIIDDILDFENTMTEESRKKITDFILNSVMSRLDPAGARLIFNNTAWHPQDAVHHLAKKHASLRMTITGDIHVHDDPQRTRAGLPYWDHPLLRPRYADGEDPTCRLVRDGYPDLENSIPLFPERFYYTTWDMPDGSSLPPATTMDEAIRRALLDIENKRYDLEPSEFNRLHMGIARSDETAYCKEEYVETCKAAARAIGHFEMVSKYEGSNPTFTGVDLAIGLGEEHDETAFFTFEVLPDRRRKILDIEIGRWPGPTIVRKVIQKQTAYDSIVRIENVAAQDYLRQQVLNLDASLPIKAHTTGRIKAHPEYGVQGGFAEMHNGAWLIPNDRAGRCHPHVQKWVDGCLYYSPAKHTADSVMAWYFAREQAKEWGLLSPLPKEHGRAGQSVIGAIFG